MNDVPKNGTATTARGSRRIGASHDAAGNRVETQRPRETASGLSEAEQGYLARLENKLQLARDRTAAVALGHATGFYLFGEGGVGKSYTVLEELEQRKVHYVLANSRMTGRGLYNQLEKFPDAIHVLEDMEALTRDKGAQGVLRSALWGQRRDGGRGPMERPVTWTTHVMEHSFVFTGGIIMLANRPLGLLPELDAIRTRISVLHLQATDQEMRALMRKVALAGFEHEGKRLATEECLEVCDYVIAQSKSLHSQLNMRVLVNSFQDYLQWQEGDAGCHWHDAVAARLRERPTWFCREVSLGSRATKKQQELEIVRQIKDLDRDERLQVWVEQTSKSESALYRRLGELV
jgi:hypothetical protein